MKLEGLHHITMITADAQRNVAFYADTLGLRMIKKTVNFDSPDAYHLYFGDEHGSPGSILTWFEFPGARAGRAGTGMIHTLQLGVASESALDFWAQRLDDHGHPSQREHAGNLRFHDPDGLQLEFVIADRDNPPLRAEHPDVPDAHAILGVEGARAYGRGPDYDAAEQLLTRTLGLTALGDGAYRLDGGRRRFRWAYDPAIGTGVQGAGTVHHIAWHSRDEDHVAWQARVGEAGARVTPVIDRDYFRALYFAEPSGVLFEIATTSPGFAVDEDAARLGEELRLPRQHEPLRERLEQLLTPIVNPRAAQRERAAQA